jgi:hypothetical protein
MHLESLTGGLAQLSSLVKEQQGDPGSLLVLDRAVIGEEGYQNVGCVKRDLFTQRITMMRQLDQDSNILRISCAYHAYGSRSQVCGPLRMTTD